MNLGALVRVEWLYPPCLQSVADDTGGSGDVALRYAEPFSEAGVRHRLALYIAQTGMKDAG